MKEAIQLKEDGTLVAPLEDDAYMFKTESTVTEEELVGEQKFVVTSKVTVYYMGTSNSTIRLVHKEETSREEVQVEPLTAEIVSAQSKAIVNLITDLRTKAAPLIKDLPLKNIAQREYALTVANADLEFAKLFMQLPSKYHEIVIQ